MSTIEDLELRITQAFDRIAYSSGRLMNKAPAAAGGEDVAALQAALAEERDANAQLEERVKAIRDKQDTQVSVLKAQVDTQSAALSALEDEVARLRAANETLRMNNAALRDANEAGVGDPELINDGLKAALDSLEAERSTDRAEIDGVMSMLTPLLQQAATDASKPSSDSPEEIA